MGETTEYQISDGMKTDALEHRLSYVFYDANSISMDTTIIKLIIVEEWSRKQVVILTDFGCKREFYIPAGYSAEFTNEIVSEMKLLIREWKDSHPKANYQFLYTWCPDAEEKIYVGRFMVPLHSASVSDDSLKDVSSKLLTHMDINSWTYSFNIDCNNHCRTIMPAVSLDRLSGFNTVIVSYYSGKLNTASTIWVVPHPNERRSGHGAPIKAVRYARCNGHHDILDVLSDLNDLSAVNVASMRQWNIIENDGTTWKVDSGDTTGVSDKCKSLLERLPRHALVVLPIVTDNDKVLDLHLDLVYRADTLDTVFSSMSYARSFGGPIAYGHHDTYKLFRIKGCSIKTEDDGLMDYINTLMEGILNNVESHDEFMTHITESNKDVIRHYPPFWEGDNKLIEELLAILSVKLDITHKDKWKKVPYKYMTPLY